MRKLLAKTEFIFVVIILVLYSGGPLPVILSGGASEGSRETAPPDFAIIRLIFLLSYIVAVALLLPLWRKAIYLLVKEKFVLILTALTLISLLWSFIPSLTLQRSVGLIGTTLFGVYLASRYSLKEQIKILKWTLSIALLLSLIFAFALPKYGVMGGVHAGAWRGIYTHKNVLGKITVLSTTFFWLITAQARKLNLWLWLTLSVSILLLVLTRSTSSIVNCIILISASLIFKTLKWHGRLAIPAILFLLAITATISLVIALNSDAVFSLLGKDASLTGRSELWPAVITMIAKHPWAGYGFSGFWKDLNSEGGYVWKVTNWTPPNAHNGVLDLLLDLGLLGLGVFLASYLSSLIKSVSMIRLTKTLQGMWALIYITYLALINIAESSLLIQNNIFWVLYVAIALSLRNSSNLEFNTIATASKVD